MKSKLSTLAFIGLLFVGLTSSAFAATTSGTLAVSNPTVSGSSFQQVVLSMTSDALGNVVSDDVTIQGQIVKVIFDPGSAVPTDDWDVTLLDTSGNDVLLGLGADHNSTFTQTANYVGTLGGVFSTTTKTQTVNTYNVFVPWLVYSWGKHTVTVTNAGAAKTMTMRVIVKLD